MGKQYRIAVAGTGYIGLSIAILLAQHHIVTAVETAVKQVISYNSDVIIVIKSTIPVGYTESIREKTGSKNILFSPEFLRESKALYDNVYPVKLVA